LSEKQGEALKSKLKELGLSNAAINAAWPRWWSDDALSSPSAILELYFSVARKLGLDPRSLAHGDSPQFVWREQARFKHLTSESLQERAAISSFGRAVGALLLTLVPEVQLTEPPDAATLRRTLLGEGHPFVGLAELLSLCWSVGIPVIHLRVLPRERKRMAAMAVRVGSGGAILLARDSMYPASIAFYVAHELGHLLLGHLAKESAIVELAEELQLADDDAEERAADRFALELLTGSANVRVAPEFRDYNAPALAQAVLEAGPRIHIEPGTLAMLFGFSTNRWAVVNSAMGFIYDQAKPAWQAVNAVAQSPLDLSLAPKDSLPFLESILGIE
jgi:hypothetical protein